MIWNFRTTQILQFFSETQHAAETVSTSEITNESDSISREGGRVNRGKRSVAARGASGVNEGGNEAGKLRESDVPRW